jgi:hypothetical protein
MRKWKAVVMTCFDTPPFSLCYERTTKTPTVQFVHLRATQYVYYNFLLLVSEKKTALPMRSCMFSICVRAPWQPVNKLFKVCQIKYRIHISNGHSNTRIKTSTGFGTLVRHLKQDSETLYRNGSLVKYQLLMANHYYTNYGSSNILFPFHHQFNNSFVNVMKCIN